jgi:hypothetical protein
MSGVVVATANADSAATPPPHMCAVQNQSHCRLSSRTSRRSPTSALFQDPIRSILKRNIICTEFPNIRVDGEEGAGVCLFW